MQSKTTVNTLLFGSRGAKNVGIYKVFNAPSVLKQTWNTIYLTIFGRDVLALKRPRQKDVWSDGHGQQQQQQHKYKYN